MQGKGTGDLGAHQHDLRRVIDPSLSNAFTSPSIRRVLQLDDDADRGKHQGADPEHGSEQALPRPIGIGQHRLDRIGAGVAKHSLDRVGDLAVDGVRPKNSAATAMAITMTGPIENTE